MKILDLVLKTKWYDMIEQGIKHEEYREIKSYWVKRFTNLNNHDSLLFSQRNGYTSINEKGYTHVRFRKGYSKTSIIFTIENITTGKGNTDWGAPVDEEVFIIKLSDKPLNTQLNDAVQDIIKDTGSVILSGGEVTVQSMADKVSEAFKTILCDDNLNFTFKGNLNDFNLIPSDEYTLKVLKKIES